MIYYEKNGIILRDAVKEDIEAMKDNLRKHIAAEVWASHHHTPEQALKYSFDISTMSFTCVNNGEPVCMFGICPATLLGNEANIWMLGTDGIDKMKKTFFMLSVMVLKSMLKMYPVLSNYVDARYTASINWLSRCGAVFSEPKPYGDDKLLFCKFVLRRT